MRIGLEEELADEKLRNVIRIKNRSFFMPKIII
jgi:hypothetical protein